MPPQNAPMKNQGPSMVLYQWGSRLITQSYDRKVITTAYTSTMAGASRVIFW